MVRMCAGDPNCTGIATSSTIKSSGYPLTDSLVSSSPSSSSSYSPSSSSSLDSSPLVKAITDLSKSLNTAERSEYYKLSNEDLKFKSKPITVAAIDGAPAQTISPREAEFNKNVNDAIYRSEQNNDKYDDSDLPDFPLNLGIAFRTGELESCRGG